ncbi:MAG: hypothetical protein ACYDC6_09525 [Acidobacteriaceae bacterium]
MKNPEGDGGIVEANFVWILRYAQNDSLFCRGDSLSCQAQGSESTPLKPKNGLSGPPAHRALEFSGFFTPVVRRSEATYVQNDSHFARGFTVLPAQGSKSAPFKPKNGLNRPPARISDVGYLLCVLIGQTPPLGFWCYIFSSMRKNLPIILLGFALVALVSASCYTEARYQNKQDSSVSNVPIASVAQGEGGQSSYETLASRHSSISHMLLAWPEGVTALAVLLTLFFIAWQAILMRQTVSASDDTSQRELRAYLAVVIGSAIFQERRSEDKGGDLKFECRPLLVNTGRTPARNIVFKARAAIMPIPLPKEINLPDVPDDGGGGSILGSQQNANMFATVDGFCADKEVNDIKRGIGTKGLYVWGRVTYEDVFGVNHFTRFCQHIYWDLLDNVRGIYLPGRNDAD